MNVIILYNSCNDLKLKIPQIVELDANQDPERNQAFPNKKV